MGRLLADAPESGAAESARLAPQDREAPDRFVGVEWQAHVVLADGLAQDLLAMLVHGDAETAEEVLLVVAVEGAPSIERVLDEVVVAAPPPPSSLNRRSARSMRSVARSATC